MIKEQVHMWFRDYDGCLVTGSLNFYKETKLWEWENQDFDPANFMNELNKEYKMSKEQKIHELLKQINDSTIDIVRKEQVIGETFCQKLTIRQRRKLGLTRFGILKAVRHLQKQPDWDKDGARGLMAMDVAIYLSQDSVYASAWENMNPALDWDAVIEYIIKMLPIILKIITILIIL